MLHREKMDTKRRDKQWEREVDAEIRRQARAKERDTKRRKEKIEGLLRKMGTTTSGTMQRGSTMSETSPITPKPTRSTILQQRHAKKKIKQRELEERENDALVMQQYEPFRLGTERIRAGDLTLRGSTKKCKKIASEDSRGDAEALATPLPPLPEGSTLRKKLPPVDLDVPDDKWVRRCTLKKLGLSMDAFLSKTSILHEPINSQLGAKEGTYGDLFAVRTHSLLPAAKKKKAFWYVMAKPREFDEYLQELEFLRAYFILRRSFLSDATERLFGKVLSKSIWILADVSGSMYRSLPLLKATLALFLREQVAEKCDYFGLSLFNHEIKHFSPALVPTRTEENRGENRDAVNYANVDAAIRFMSTGTADESTRFSLALRAVHSVAPTVERILVITDGIVHDSEDDLAEATAATSAHVDCVAFNVPEDDRASIARLKSVTKATHGRFTEYHANTTELAQMLIEHKMGERSQQQKKEGGEEGKEKRAGKEGQADGSNDDVGPAPISADDDEMSFLQQLFLRGLIPDERCESTGLSKLNAEIGKVDRLIQRASGLKAELLSFLERQAGMKKTQREAFQKTITTAPLSHPTGPTPTHLYDEHGRKRVAGSRTGEENSEGDVEDEDKYHDVESLGEYSLASGVTMPESTVSMTLHRAATKYLYAHRQGGNDKEQVAGPGNRSRDPDGGYGSEHQHSSRAVFDSAATNDDIDDDASDHEGSIAHDAGDFGVGEAVKGQLQGDLFHFHERHQPRRRRQQQERQDAPSFMMMSELRQSLQKDEELQERRQRPLFRPPSSAVAQLLERRHHDTLVHSLPPRGEVSSRVSRSQLPFDVPSSPTRRGATVQVDVKREMAENEYPRTLTSSRHLPVRMVARNQQRLLHEQEKAEAAATDPSLLTNPRRRERPFARDAGRSRPRGEKTRPMTGNSRLTRPTLARSRSTKVATAKAPEPSKRRGKHTHQLQAPVNTRSFFSEKHVLIASGVPPFISESELSILVEQLCPCVVKRVILPWDDVLDQNASIGYICFYNAVDLQRAAALDSFIAHGTAVHVRSASKKKDISHDAFAPNASDEWETASVHSSAPSIASTSTSAASRGGVTRSHQHAPGSVLSVQRAGINPAWQATLLSL